MTATAASMNPLLRRVALPTSSALHVGKLAPLRRRLSLPSPFEIRRNIPAYLIPLAATTFSNLSSFLSSLWDAILLAVPKQKTSHSKSRSRQLAGKALKDVTNLVHCSACGRVKRAHILCPYCVALNQQLWKRASKSQKADTKVASQEVESIKQTSEPSKEVLKSSKQTLELPDKVFNSTKDPADAPDLPTKSRVEFKEDNRSGKRRKSER